MFDQYNSLFSFLTYTPESLTLLIRIGNTWFLIPHSLSLSPRDLPSTITRAYVFKILYTRAGIIRGGRNSPEHFQIFPERPNWLEKECRFDAQTLNKNADDFGIEFSNHRKIRIIIVGYCLSMNSQDNVYALCMYIWDIHEYCFE